MGQEDTTEIKQSKTPEALYSAIERHLSKSGGLSHEDAYTEAINALIGFRKTYNKLPDLPNNQVNAVAGLQEVMDWCIRAIDIVDHMVDDMNRDVIDEFICKLNKLKELPAKGFPKIQKRIWKKAEDRAQKILDKYEKGKKRPHGLCSFYYCSRRTKFMNVASIISSLADVADRKAGKSNHLSYLLRFNSIADPTLNKQIDDSFIKMGFYRQVERICRLMDANYTNALAKLEESIITVFKEWNTLNATETGDLLDRYDNLKGIELQYRINKLANAYSINSIVDTALFGSGINLPFGGESKEMLVDGLIETLHNIRNKIKRKPQRKQGQNGEESVRDGILMSASSSKEIWAAIEKEYDISKRDFEKKINFVSDSFKKNIIFRDVEHAFVLASEGFAKPAIILAGGVIEELLRLYLEHKNIKPQSNKFDEYIKSCEQNKLLKKGISQLSDSVRHFRNQVHLEKEETKRHTVTKPTAKGAVASIFTIVNDFQSAKI